jgi:hypothetical protein
MGLEPRPHQAGQVGGGGGAGGPTRLRVEDGVVERIGEAPVLRLTRPLHTTNKPCAVKPVLKTKYERNSTEAGANYTYRYTYKISQISGWISG